MKRGVSSITYNVHSRNGQSKTIVKRVTFISASARYSPPPQHFCSLIVKALPRVSTFFVNQKLTHTEPRHVVHWI